MTEYKNTLTRQFAIYESLRKHTYRTSAELSEDCGISLRTLQRDLKVLKDEELIQNEGNKYFLREKYKLTDVSFSPEEMASLLVAEKLSTAMIETSFAKHYQEAIKKVKDKINKKEHSDKEYFDLLDNIRVYNFVPTYRSEEEIFGKKDFALFTKLQEAIKEKRYIELDYYSYHRRQTFHYKRLEPVTFSYYLNNWYLIAFNPETQERVFCRFEEIDLTTVCILGEQFKRHNRKEFVKECYAELERGFTVYGYSLYIAQWLFSLIKYLPTNCIAYKELEEIAKVIRDKAIKEREDELRSWGVL